ncbi:ABC transporter permease [Acidobacteriota bacterium]
MFRNFLTIAYRNVVKYKSYSLINIIGFALGISCFLLIIFFVRDELSYDMFHTKANRIYRVSEIYTQSGNVQYIANSSGPWGPALTEDYPEVEASVRLMPPVTQVLVSRMDSDLHFYEEKFVYADDTVFDVFDFELLFGDIKSVLKEPNSVLLTQSTAAKYFGSDDPIGKTIVIDKKIPFVVSGILKDVPRTSHLKFDFLASFITLENPIMREYIPMLRFFLDRRGTIYTYILLSEGASADELEKKMPDFMEKYAGEYLRTRTLNTLMPTLQPLKSIHLNSHFEREWEPNGNIQHVVIFLAVAIFVLLIACFNFMNLSTARSALRAREVGLRKVVGAERPQLIFQFLSESIFMTTLSMILAVGLTHILLPVLNNLTSKQIHIDYFSDWRIIPGLVFLTFVIGLISGSYPAFVISAFHPVQVLTGNLAAAISGKTIRKILTVVQFSISIGLIVGLLVVKGQMDFIKNTDLGYDKDQVVVLPLSNAELREGYMAYKESILTFPRILYASGSSTLMGKPPLTREARPADAGDEANMSYRRIEADVDFLKTYKMEILSGSDFTHDLENPNSEATIISEETVRSLGLENPVGANFNMIKPVQAKRIIAVVKNFHIESLHEAIQPVIISLGRNDPLRFLSVRIVKDNVTETLKNLRQKWMEIFPGVPFQYSFFDEDFDALYKAEERLGKIFIYFTVLALIIACLGLLGLAAFVSQRRAKEIGIRKVLGANVTQIVSLLLKEFIMLVGVANIIAWPLAYVLMRGWLQNFAYRISISFVTFIIAGFLALALAVLTVGFQSLKSAIADPVRSIRYE